MSSKIMIFFPREAGSALSAEASVKRQRFQIRLYVYIFMDFSAPGVLHRAYHQGNLREISLKSLYGALVLDLFSGFAFYG